MAIIFQYYGVVGHMALRVSYEKYHGQEACVVLILQFYGDHSHPLSLCCVLQRNIIMWLILAKTIIHGQFYITSQKDYSNSCMYVAREVGYRVLF